MEGRLRTILEQLPPDPPRSKLEPYADLIWDLRRRRKTYRAIAAFLAEHCNLQVQHSTIYDFVRVRKRDLTPSQSQSQLNPPCSPCTFLQIPTSVPPLRTRARPVRNHSPNATSTPTSRNSSAVIALLLRRNPNRASITRKVNPSNLLIAQNIHEKRTEL
jgi:hypothetical protein